jgi:enoyl-CoA hydratase/carnithine racemase
MSADTATANSPGRSTLMLLREDIGGVAVLTLNQPQSRNALSEAMLGALGDALTAIAHDASVRAVVLAGKGPAYCAGHDLKELSRHRSEADGGRAYFKHIMTMCSTMMQQIITLPQPVIAAVQGPASAAGCQLVASCDLAIASKAAKFATPGVHIGLFCSTPMVALSRDVSRKHAMEMLLTGDMVSAEDAHRFGLVNRIARPDALEADTMKLAQQIAAKPRATVKIGKEAFYNQLEMGLSHAYDYASKVMTENMLHAEANEGIGAFVEKRDPKWPE